MTLFDRVFGGNDYNYARTVAAIDEAIAANGEGCAVSFPGTAYSLPCYYGVTGVKITTAQKRYGSCSGKNSLCFSCFLMRQPEAAIDLVVVHELCHIREKNHGPAFYALLARYLPDYKERKKLLK